MPVVPPVVPSPVRPPPRLALALALLALAGGASAAERCGDPSPALERLGARYAEPGLEPPGDGAIARGTPAARLLETLRDATLVGVDGERVRCRGTDGTARELRWRLGLEQLERVRLLGGDVVLSAFEARRAPASGTPGHAVAGDARLVGGALVAEVIDVPPAAAWRTGADGRSIEANRRVRRRGAASAYCAAPAAPLPRPLDFPPDGGAGGPPRCAPLTEIATTARADGRTIELEQTFYVNGRWSERVIWRLRS